MVKPRGRMGAWSGGSPSAQVRGAGQPWEILRPAASGGGSRTHTPERTCCGSSPEHAFRKEGLKKRDRETGKPGSESTGGPLRHSVWEEGTSPGRSSVSKSNLVMACVHCEQAWR